MANPVWIFGSGNGLTYAENSRALFEYTHKNERSITPIWLTKNKDIKKKLVADGYRAYSFYSLKGMYYALKSQKTIISNSFLDISLIPYVFLPRKRKIIQLWHGTPLKILENTKWPIHKKALIKFFLTYVGRDCDIICTASSLNNDAYIKNFNVSEDQIKLTGQPRNDYLDSLSTHNSTNKIWYVPTFREYNKSYDFFEPNHFNLEKMNDFLKSTNTHLSLKLHPVDAKKFNAYASNFASVTNISVESPANFYEELGKSIALITDYSSVYFDYLLIDKPIIFAAFDLEEYKSKRGFYYSYNDVAPGPIASDWENVLSHLKKILNGQDDWKLERKRVNEDFNHFRDFNSSERVFKEIIKTNHD